MFKRRLFFNILPQLNHKNAIVITGMRQVGKTTLMRQLYEEWDGKAAFYDLDNPLNHLVFENPDFSSIYRDLCNDAGAESGERILVCIDEIQNFPEITRIIKYLIDHYKVKFIVTGSSNYYLRNLFPESLSGRKFLYVLNPLNYREFLHFRGELPVGELDPNWNEVIGKHSRAHLIKRKAFYEEYLEYGGFPEVVITTEHTTKKLILQNIFTSFFEKDIKVFSQLKEVRELRDLIRLLGPRNGNLIDVTRLSSELGINRVKTYGYLEFLEGTFFLRLLPKHTSSIDRSVAGGKKVYFSDTGLLNLVSKVNEGQLLETAVANQLHDYGQLSFYNKRNTSEIDFILNGQIALEVKQKALASDLSKLSKLAATLKLPDYYLISSTLTEGEKVIYPWTL